MVALTLTPCSDVVAKNQRAMRHCEEGNDEAIQGALFFVFWIASSLGLCLTPRNDAKLDKPFTLHPSRNKKKEQSIDYSFFNIIKPFLHVNVVESCA